MIEYNLVKELGFDHLDMGEYIAGQMKKMFLYKSSQNPDIYHRDYLAVLNQPVKEVIWQCPFKSDPWQF